MRLFDACVVSDDQKWFAGFGVDVAVDFETELSWENVDEIALLRDLKTSECITQRCRCAIAIWLLGMLRIEGQDWEVHWKYELISCC